MIDGYRRIEACKMLGWKEIPVNRINLENLVRGEHDANVFRKDFTPSEAVAIGRELEPELKKKAQERMKAGKPSSKLDEGRTDEKVGSIVGMGKDTYRKAKEIVDASEESPDNFREIKEQMDEGEISIDRAHRQVKRAKSKEEREKKAKEMPKPPALDRGEFPLNEVILWGLYRGNEPTSRKFHPHGHVLAGILGLTRLRNGLGCLGWRFKL